MRPMLDAAIYRKIKRIFKRGGCPIRRPGMLNEKAWSDFTMACVVE